jgi:hypothetical protein
VTLRRILAPLAHLTSAAALAALSLFLPACSGWLSVDRVASAQKKPNNVWVFLSVQRSRDEPITGLASGDFTIYEDGNLLAEASSKQLLQAPEVAAVTYTLLLVDLSGSGASGPPDALVDAARAFAERVGKTQKVAIYGFDGEPKIHPLVPFAEPTGAAPAREPAGKARAPADPFDAMRRFKAKDPSTNLYGATVEALHELRRVMDREQRPIKFGTLVVYAEGIDRAARVSRWDMRNEMDDDKYKLYEVFGVGSGAEHSFVEDVGRDGTDVPLDRAGVKDALDRIAGKIELHAQRYYLLSFCTAARKGDHEVKITARVKQPPEGSGSLSYSFKADGLGPPPDCDPKAPPAFDMKPPEEKKDDAKPSGKGAPQGGPKPVLIGPPAGGGSP